MNRQKCFACLDAKIARDALGDVHRKFGVSRAAFVRRDDARKGGKRKLVGYEWIIRGERRREKAVAGKTVRAVLESVGIRDVLSKSLGSKNPANVVKATLGALKQLRLREQIYASRGLEIKRPAKPPVTATAAAAPAPGAASTPIPPVTPLAAPEAGLPPTN